MAKYVTYNDYSREMVLRPGMVETIWHCGRCMTIKAFKGADCSYCKDKKRKKDESLNRLAEYKEDKGEDLI